MKKITWQTEKRKISELTPFKENPRFMTEQQAKDLKESIEKFGLVEIPVINTNNMILAGHQRIQTLKDIGDPTITKIEVRVPSRKLTTDEAVEYLLRSNKNTGSWDEEKLFDFGEDTLLSVGFSDQEVTGIFDRQRTKDDDFDIEEAEGNVWENLETLKTTFDGKETVLKIGNYHLKIKGKVEGEICRKNDSVDIWYEKKPVRSSEHPTMKPVALVAKAIKASSILGGTVLDLFVGSGTTIVASEETGRVCFAMEMEPKYVQVCIDRWQLLTGKEVIKCQ